MKNINHRTTSFPLTVLLFLLALSLSGCGYSNEIKQSGAAAAGEYIMVVQNAVDQFQKLTQVLPIKTKDMNTPIFEKYPIDFNKLKERHLLSTIPTNAFENGGSAVYVLINVETKPEVKLLDLVSYQKLAALQKNVDDYKQKHGGQIPGGEQAYPGWYWLDYGKLSLKAESMSSPYSRQALSVVIHESGQLAIDYALDIVKLQARSGGNPPDSDADLRNLLTTAGFYVPVRSYPYRWQNGQLVLLPPT